MCTVLSGQGFTRWELSHKGAPPATLLCGPVLFQFYFAFIEFIYNLLSGRGANGLKHTISGVSQTRTARNKHLQGHIFLWPPVTCVLGHPRAPKPCVCLICVRLYGLYQLLCAGLGTDSSLRMR